MNDELRKIAIEAGAPDEMINMIWFNVFCQKFAHLIILAVEEEME